MNVLSLFDGMSCGQLALERAGIAYDNYYASEVDKYAITVTQANYPDTIQIGDVLDISGEHLPTIDLLIGGSPCQGFSFAGDQLNFDDPRSKLFFEFVRLLEECKPRYFLLENVRMKKVYEEIISSYLDVAPIQINSALVSAQNRVRLYWTNIPGVKQPLDKGILLGSILEDGEVKRDKSQCIPTTIYKENTKSMLKRNKMGLCIQVGEADIKGNDSIKRIYSPDGKAPCLTTMEGGHRESKVAILDKHDSRNNLKCVGGLLKNKKWLEDGKTLQRNFSQGERIYSIEGKSPTLSANSGGSAGAGSALITEDIATWRKLTPIECERLQTVPDEYTKKNLDIHYQKLYHYGNGNNVEEDTICKLVKSRAVINPSQVGKLNFAINTILDSLEMEVLNLKESLLIKAKSVQVKDANEIVKLLGVSASSTINLGKEHKMQYPKNVRFVVERSVIPDGEGFVYAMQLLNPDMETHYAPIKMRNVNLNLMEAQIKSTTKIQKVDGFTEMLLNKLLVENCEKEKLRIILTLINWIIAKAIFLFVKPTPHIYLYIDSLNLLQGNSLEMELSALKMESIVETSNFARYKMLGNGWTVDVIAHIFKNLKGNPEPKKKDVLGFFPLHQVLGINKG